jgi:hypothetical protein
MIEENVGSQTLSPKAASILAAGQAKKDAASKSAESAASAASNAASDLADDASSTISSASSEASDTASSLADEASSTGKKVFAGAHAQVLVEAREPILDDIVDTEATYSERVQEILDGVKDQASYLTQVVEDAFKAATTTQGTVESVTSVANEQYESALAAASSVLFGTEKGAVEKGSEAARAQYLSAVTA